MTTFPKLGIYTLDRTHGMGGAGIFCNPTLKPFPYDEVKSCSFIDDGYGFFAFRIGKKWGIIKIVAFNNEEEGVYDVEYNATKRRIIVPCEYVALADAELQLRLSLEWEYPFRDEHNFIEEEPDKKDKTEEENKVHPIHEVSIGNGTNKIRVTFPNGDVIEDSVIWKTVAETIKRLGVERVAKLKIIGIGKSNILFVDTKRTTSSPYNKSQKEIAPGYYFLAYFNIEDYRKRTQEISDRLRANLKIEIISY